MISSNFLFPIFVPYLQIGFPFTTIQYNQIYCKRCCRI